MRRVPGMRKNNNRRNDCLQDKIITFSESAMKKGNHKIAIVWIFPLSAPNQNLRYFKLIMILFCFFFFSFSHTIRSRFRLQVIDSHSVRFCFVYRHHRGLTFLFLHEKQSRSHFYIEFLFHINFF